MVGLSPKKKSKPSKLIGLGLPRVHKSSTNVSGQDHSRKPLFKKKYYLDLKNNSARKKLQESLIALGATVEEFFDRGVNGVVTDRHQWLASLGKNSGPTPSPFQSPASSVDSQSVDDQTPRRNKTRLDCILEQARLRPVAPTLDPLDVARSSGVPIHSYSKFLQLLERFKAKEAQQSLATRRLTRHYIKFENCDKQSKPIAEEFDKWTFINLNGSFGSSPFSTAPPQRPAPSSTLSAEVPAALNRRSSASKETSKKATELEANDKPTASCKSLSRMTRGPKISGFCEMCNVPFSSQQSHILCKSHVKYAKSDVNYLALDAIISRGANMDAFVKLNKVDTLNYRRSLRSECRLDLMSPHTVNGGLRKRSKAAGARTRSMSGGQLYLPSGLLGTTAEDVGNPVRTVLGTSPGRKRATNERASSADEVRLSPPKPEMNGGRRRRLLAKRRSQLAVLSDEAQNFMFREPAGQGSSDEGGEEEDDEDDQEVSPSSRISVKIEPDSNSLDSQGVRRKKRRSQAEAFIDDNREYYKFETPSSRLRFHDKDIDIVNREVNCTDRDCRRSSDGCLVKNEGCTRDCLLKKECCATMKGADVKREPLGEDVYHFSFERAPRSEPWFQTFERQDRGEEFYYSLPSSADEPFLLPYELPLPRLAHLTSSGFLGRGRRRGRFGHLERKPRKSPRCHASTLAILSGFINRRKRDPNRAREAAGAKEVAEVKEEPPPPPTVIHPPSRPRGRPRRKMMEEAGDDSEKKGSETEGDFTKLAESLDEALEISGDELDMLDVPLDPEHIIPLDKPAPGVRIPVFSLMQERCDCCVRQQPETSKKSSPRHAEWRTRKRKKRKFNLTGWPDAKKKSRPGPEDRLRRLRVKEERASRERDLFNDLNEETNCSSYYTDCDGASDTMEHKVERLDASYGDESADSDEHVLAHFMHARKDRESAFDDDDDDAKSRFSLPEYCIPSTRRLRSAGTPLPRRESPRKIKTIKNSRESVS